VVGGQGDTDGVFTALFAQRGNHRRAASLRRSRGVAQLDQTAQRDSLDQGSPCWSCATAASRWRPVAIH